MWLAPFHEQGNPDIKVGERESQCDSGIPSPCFLPAMKKHFCQAFAKCLGLIHQELNYLKP